ncbi:sugar ABC transporter substrate-binding protein [Yeosuana marina]|uniref:sugar ABC transporter substrate-binding protein n=1 Tax=Yeosuana marina TaxID=1565536 RepID=UPI0014241C83|nr:sugar ABC transporter substrate-binding protein [Yeosuana marina]
MITIKDIAKEANVSEGTVDRVLHNRSGVSTKTKEKVKKIIKKYNFKTNPIASALALKKKFKIAYLIPKYDEQNVFWKFPDMGITKACEEVENYGVIIEKFTFDQFNSLSYLKEFSKLIKGEPDVVVIVPMFKEETIEITKKLESLNLPYIFMNINLEGYNNFSFIGQDSYKSGFVAGKLMCLSLKEETTCLTIQTRSNISNYLAISKRIEGFNDYISSNNIKITNLNLTINLDNLALVKKELNNLLEENPKIKGVYVPSSRVGIISDLIEKNKIKTLHIIGFDTTEKNVKGLENNTIKFLISQKAFNQGYESVLMMSDFLLYKKIPPKKVYSPIQIIIKENVEFYEPNKKSF